MVKWTLLILLLGVTLARPAMAQGHHAGPGAWIPANPAYVNADGTHCCGLSHCKPPEAGSLTRLPGGKLQCVFEATAG